ncbi:MAG TPA: M28 family peptidase [Coriobacteriia bacterium]
MAEQSPYLAELAEGIGPRPATSDAEARAAAYIAGVMSARGLEVETQEFDSPRTYSWAYVIYYLLTIAAAVLSNRLTPYALVLALVVAVVMRRDLDTRWGLSTLMPKGPSQNVIARHVPKQRRGERLRKVVVVAHYDSARASLAFSPGMVKNFAFTFGLMKWCTYLVPVLIAVQLLPFMKRFDRIPWYVTMAVSAYLLIPLLINVHRELLMRATPGANDNASGVAAMLGVMDRLVPEPGSDEDVFTTTSFPRVEPTRRTEEDAWAADVVPDDAVLSYSPPAGPRKPFEESDFDDIGWADDSPSKDQTSMPLEEGTDEDAWKSFAEGKPAEAPPVAQKERRRNPLLPGRRREPQPAEPPAPENKENVRDWLGVDEGFDAKQEGRKIGSWDHFGEEGDDDSGWKGGAAGESIDDPDFASSEAARIRRRVLAGEQDRDLSEKEVWFVATGAEEVGTIGMKALLDQYGEDLRDAHIINLDNLGSGSLSWITSEGMAKRYTADRRLSGAARRVATENDWAIKGREYRGLSTDATAALARRFKAMSVMAFDINGRLPNWHWETDTVSEVSADNVALAVDFTTALIKEL